MRQQQQMPMAQAQQPMPQSMPAAQPMPQTQMPQVKPDSVHAGYLSKTMPIIAAIVAENPSYQQHVGSCIF
jgi:hypothetical protein